MTDEDYTESLWTEADETNAALYDNYPKPGDKNNDTSDTKVRTA